MYDQVWVFPSACFVLCVTFIPGFVMLNRLMILDTRMADGYRIIWKMETV